MNSYDNNGNTLTKLDATGTTTYTWDFENRLTSVLLPGSGGTVTFKYDPFGRRIYKSSSSGTSIYAYDQGNLIEEVNGSGAVVARYADTLHIDRRGQTGRSLTLLATAVKRKRHPKAVWTDYVGTTGDRRDVCPSRQFAPPDVYRSLDRWFRPASYSGGSCRT